MNFAQHVSIILVAAIIGACSVGPNKPTSPTSVPAAPVTADIAGKWNLSVQTLQGTADSTMTVVQSGSSIKGTLTGAMGTVDFTGTVNGKDVKFGHSIEQFGAPAGSVVDYAGIADGATMKGRAKFAAFGEGDWTAKRP
jgi:hypothetical protein